MSKKNTDENGHIYVKTKPFYKKIWFWVLVVILVLVFGGMGGSKKESKPKNGGTKVETKSSESNKKETEVSTSALADGNHFYQVGESVNVGGIIYTLKSVTLTDERNQFDEKKPEHVIRVEYDMKNETDKDVPVGMDLAGYGPDTKKLDRYPNDNTMGAVAPGKSIDVVQHFGLNQLGKIELQFSPLVSLEKTANFEVEVE